MRWGDYIEEPGPIDMSDIAMVVHENLELLTEQAVESLPILEGFDNTRGYRIGWWIEQDDKPIQEEQP